jgi:hypothetical protein
MFMSQRTFINLRCRKEKRLHLCAILLLQSSKVFNKDTQIVMSDSVLPFVVTCLLLPMFRGEPRLVFRVSFLLLSMLFAVSSRTTCLRHNVRMLS